MYLGGARGLTILPKFDSVFLGLVGKFPHSRLKQLCCHGHIAAGVLQGIDDHLSFETGYGLIEGAGWHSARLLSGLQSWGEVITSNHASLAKENGPLDAILEFAHISRPVVLHEHIDGWG